MNYYISDTHFGHQNVLQFDNRPFSDIEEMDRQMISFWNETVSKDDDVYILGDFCFRSQHAPSWYLKQLSGRKHLIQGNHDKLLLNDPQSLALLESVDKMLFVQDCGQKLVLCHFPFAEWNGFYKGAWHIYGHIHARTDGAGQYMRSLERALNAGCMINGYCPVTFHTLVDNNLALRSTSPASNTSVTAPNND